MTVPPQDIIRIGTRGSRLALWQADEVAARLTAVHRGLKIERTIVKTIGDKNLDTPLSKIGDKGLFTKELDAALQCREIDLAVHSLKDLPTKVSADLAIGAILERENPCDALISPSGRRLAELPRGARVGTSSPRRRSQLLALRPDLEILDLRGNVPTRIEKAEQGEYDAIVLARAGVLRLGLIAKVTEELGPERMLPAVGQGAIAIEIRAGDERVARLVGVLEHRETRLAVSAERGLLRALEGGCQVPVGALGRVSGNRVALDGLVADLEGKRLFRGSDEGEAVTAAAATAIGERLAGRLLDMGAREVLARIIAMARPAPPPAPGGEE